MKVWPTSRATLASLISSLLLCACASTNKPTLPLIYASAALKGAERKQADRKAPDRFNEAQQAMWSANRLYLAKEFEESAKYALEAQRKAEQAEWEAEEKSASSDGLPGE